MLDLILTHDEILADAQFRAVTPEPDASMGHTKLAWSVRNFGHVDSSERASRLIVTN